jgi:hypothetical protein
METRDELKEFTTTLLNGFELSDTEFDSFLHLEQGRIEDLAEWEILKKESQAISLTSADTYTTLKTLPDDFLAPVSDDPIVLLSGNSVTPEFAQIPFNMRHRYKDDFGKFYIDFRQNKIGFCGSAGGSYTAAINYIYKPEDIDDDNPWPFPYRFRPVLAYGVAINYKGGVDYDAISESQARYNQQQYDLIVKSMTAWNARLAAKALEGVDRAANEVWYGGRVNINR